MKKPLTEEEAKTRGMAKALLIVGVIAVAIVVFLLFKPDIFKTYSI